MKYVLVSLIVVMVYAGCGRERGPLFVDMDPPLVWPGPPDPPRIKFLGAFSTQEDLKQQVTSAEAFRRMLFGRENIGVLIGPYGLAVDRQNRLLVADRSGAVIHMMDMETRDYHQFFALDNDQRLLSPIGVALVNDDIYISDSVLGKICVFSSQGEYQFSFGSDILQRPAGIAYNQVNQQLYVVDTKRHVINVFDPEGNCLDQLGSRGRGQGIFNFPTHIWIDHAGKIYVSDTLNYRIQVFSSEGEFLLAIGQQGDRPGYFAHPGGVATDSFGNIYVADKQFENIQIFNRQGRILMAFGGEGKAPGRFWLPAGICIDEKNRIFIADSHNKRIQVFQLLDVDEP